MFFVSGPGWKYSSGSIRMSWEYFEKPLIKRGQRYGYGRKRELANCPDR
jgi:hypothetical protein